MSLPFKRSKFIYYTLVAACLSLPLSCNKDDADSLPTIPKPECQLTSVVSGTIESRFEYNDAGQLIKFIGGYNNYIKFEYKDDRVVKLTYYYDDDESKILQTDTITYNKKGQWIKHTYALDDDKETLATYNSKGYRTLVTKNLDGNLDEIRAFEYTDGNLDKQQIDYYDTHGSLSYSTFNSYLYDLTKENKLMYFESVISLAFTEAYSGEESTPSGYMLNYDNILNADGSLYNALFYDYEYNDKGFPTTLTISGGDVNEDGIINEADISVRTYTYSNCP